MDVKLKKQKTMKAKHLLLVMAALLAAGGLWFARAAWRAHRQLVTLDIPNATLAVVLRKIEWQVWKKIRTEESLAGVHVILHAKNTPLPEVLDRLAKQAGADWNTLYAVYRDTRALKALDSALQGDGKLDPAGWTKIAPYPAALAEPGTDKPGATMMGGPNGRVEMWSPEEVVLESSLSNLLGNDLISTNSAPTTAAAAQMARKVDGRWTTFLAFHKPRMRIRFKMPRGPNFDPNSAASLTKASQTGPAPGPNNRPEPGHMLRPPDPSRRFTDFTPERRVQFARQGHGPGG
jgi:hypothetical protein